MATLKFQRDWSMKYFTENSVVNQYYVPLLTLKEKGWNTALEVEARAKPCDIIVKIIKVFEFNDDDLELRVKDTSDELFFLIVNKLKFASH